MCIPVAVIGLAISAASAAASYAQQSKQTKKAEESARNAQSLNDLVAWGQAQQINKKAADEMSDRAREAMIERGRLRVISAENGIGGNSEDQLQRQSFFDEGFDMSRIESNRAAQQRQSQLEARGVSARTQSRLNEIESKKPSLLGSGLHIAMDGVNAKAEMDRRDPSKS
jgi:hypothetical protein